jgi:hypothetical protein
MYLDYIRQGVGLRRAGAMSRLSEALKADIYNTL